MQCVLVEIKVELTIGKQLMKIFWKTRYVPVITYIHCKNSGVKFNTPGVLSGPHQVGVNFNTLVLISTQASLNF